MTTTSTQDIQKHVPNSWCVYTKCDVDKYSKLELYYGPDAPKRFVQYLHEEAMRIDGLLD